jgi:cytochrome c
MKYYYLNKIAMAVLVALLLFFGTRTLIDIIYEEHPPEKPGYEVAGAEGEAHGKKEKAVDENAAFVAALNKADPAKGEQDVALCKVCHSFDKGGPTILGPNLYGVVGHKIATHEGFNYTPGLKGHGGEWTFENLDKWLTNPQVFAAGTSMAFPGIPDLQKRADVIAYLNKNSDNPLPIPEPTAEEAAPEEAAAEGGKEEAAGGQPEIIALLATADAAKGEQDAALCKVCHTFDAGGATLVGPNLHNVVGADIAHHEGFNYSDALKGKGGKWTYEQLDAWLSDPQAFAAGTMMAFPGVTDAKKRADIIAFLMSKTDNPPPLPSAEAAPAEEPAAAEEKAAPAEEAVPAEEEAAPAEEEAAPAEEEAAPAEEEAAPAEEETAPAEEPAATKEEAKPTEEPAPAEEEAAPAEEKVMPAEEPAAEEPAAMEETISVPPTVSEDAPSEPHKGEPPSPNQPQPVVPEESPGSNMEAGSDSGDSATPANDDSLSSQPQPVYPDGPPDGL